MAALWTSRPSPNNPRAGWIDRISKAVYAPCGISKSYDKLVIATGSSVSLPPMGDLYGEEGFRKRGVFLFRSLDDCKEMIDYAATARKAVVIGGGCWIWKRPVDC